MTVLVGILCKDGVVIGADSATTFGAGNLHTIEQLTRKIDVVDDKIIIAGTGEVGLNQRFVHAVKQAWATKAFANMGQFPFGKHLSKIALQDFQETLLRQFNYGALVAYETKEGLHLVELSGGGFQPEWKDKSIWYASMGSGQTLADPFLGFMREVFWRDGPPSLQTGIFAAMWTLQHAANMNTGGVKEPLHLATLVKGKARLLGEDELEEHHTMVQEATNHLRRFEDILTGKSDGRDSIPRLAPETPKVG